MTIDGIEVRDALESLVLHIRTPDCKTGKKDPQNCAAAKAAMREPGVILAKIYRTRSYLLKGTGKGRYWERFLTPDSLRGEIIAFDRGGEFDPGDYELPRPPNSMRIGVRHFQGRTGKRATGKKRKPHVVRGIRPHGPSARHGT